MVMSMFELVEDAKPAAKIKVIGVGGCGGNAVDHMINHNVNGVEFICANTDSQALQRSQSNTLIQLGTVLTRGLGAGANPEVGRNAALEDRDRIADAIRGADMLFITAGMGGGTGTGAAPVIAQVAREMGILTVAVVTKPFDFEGKRQNAAQNGITELENNVDSLIIIPNQKLMQVLGDDVSFQDAFKAADNVLRGAVAGIAEIINVPGLVNVDFADVKAVMSEMGRSMMGTAVASGVDRARLAAEQAITCPLLEDVSLTGAKGILVNISANLSLKMKEVHEVMETIHACAAEDAKIFFGAVIDEQMGDDIRVTLVATGLENQVLARAPAKQTLQLFKTGTDHAVGGMEPNYDDLDTPVIFRRRGQTTRATAPGGVNPDAVTIPAFLRRQAD